MHKKYDTSKKNTSDPKPEDVVFARVKLVFPGLPQFGKSICRLKDGTVYELYADATTPVDRQHLKEVQAMQPFAKEVKIDG